MKTFIISCVLIPFTAGLATAQNSLTLSDCQQKAHDNYPLIKQYGLLDLSEQYTVSNIGKAWLPQISVNAQAAYQSDAVHFPVSLPGVDIPAIDKDQYRATIDLSQTIWDGGVVRSQRGIAKAGNEVEKQNVQVNLYTLQDRINQLFFGILTVDEHLKQLDILAKDLVASHQMASAFLKNGTGTQSDMDAIQVELLNAGQKKTELAACRKSYTEMLSAMTHEIIDDKTQLAKPPEVIIDKHAGIKRPEMGLFVKQNSLLDSRENMIAAMNMPRLSLFVQGGYGKPGLNMLSNNFEFFYIGGIRLNWNFSNLYSARNDRHAVINDKNSVNIRQETFVFNTNLQLTQMRNEIQKAKDLMDRDDEIILLRNRMKQAAESKYRNGICTVNDLLRDINAENQAQQAKILHEIQYLMGIYQYLTTAGNAM
jgi:outer membrane protein TolC